MDASVTRSSPFISVVTTDKTNRYASSKRCSEYIMSNICFLHTFSSMLSTFNNLGKFVVPWSQTLHFLTNVINTDAFENVASGKLLSLQTRLSLELILSALKREIIYIITIWSSDYFYKKDPYLWQEWNMKIYKGISPYRMTLVIVTVWVMFVILIFSLYLLPLNLNYNILHHFNFFIVFPSTNVIIFLNFLIKVPNLWPKLL